VATRTMGRCCCHSEHSEEFPSEGKLQPIYHLMKTGGLNLGSATRLQILRYTQNDSIIKTISTLTCQMEYITNNTTMRKFKIMVRGDTNHGERRLQV
jgi:hypothetical protein